jgi:hypothetical protein
VKIHLDAAVPDEHPLAVDLHRQEATPSRAALRIGEDEKPSRVVLGALEHGQRPATPGEPLQVAAEPSAGVGREARPARSRLDVLQYDSLHA